MSINSPVLEDRVTYTPACISLKASVLNKNKINTRLQISRDYPHGNVFFLHFFSLPLTLRDETTTTIGKSATDKTWAISVLYSPFVIKPYREFNLPVRWRHRRKTTWSSGVLFLSASFQVCLCHCTDNLGACKHLASTVELVQDLDALLLLQLYHLHKTGVKLMRHLLADSSFCSAFDSAMLFFASSKTVHPHRTSTDLCYLVCFLVSEKTSLGEICVRGDVTLRSFRTVSVGRRVGYIF